jgi:hypothetical protein
MRIETAQHQCTAVSLDLRHDQKLADGREDMDGDHRVIGQIVVENYPDVGCAPNAGMLQPNPPNAIRFFCADTARRQRQESRTAPRNAGVRRRRGR